MADSFDFLSLFQGYYGNVDVSSEPVLNPTTSEITSRFLAGTLTYPFSVELAIASLTGGVFKIEADVNKLIPNFFQLAQTRGFVNEFEVGYAEDGVNFTHLFDILPRFGGEISFTLADYQGFVATKASIFDYFLSLLGSTDPSKALQLDFPGDSVATAFDLGLIASEGLIVPGQVFDLPANEDRDFYGFSMDQGNLEIMLSSSILAGSGNVRLQLYAGNSLIKEVESVAGAAELDLQGLAAGHYFLAVDADVGSNIDYSLQIKPATFVPPLVPLALNWGATQLLYAVYYDRPGDVSGLNFWKEKIQEAGFSYSPRAGDGLTDAERPIYQRIVDDFGNGPEYEQLFFGKNNTQKMDAIYQNCFGRNSEIDWLTGENYWVAKLTRNEISLAAAAVEVALGAQAGDLTFLGNRIASADRFLQHLDTPIEQAAYGGSVAGALARDWLQTFGPSAATDSEADTVIAQIVAAVNPI